MTIEFWTGIIRQVEVRRKPEPVTEDQIIAYENSIGRRLPASYRSYCMVFGPGTIGGIANIAVPGSERELSWYSLEGLAGGVRSTGYRQYAVERHIAQIERSIFFGSDESRQFYFFDPEDVRGDSGQELGVYILRYSYYVHRLCDTYSEFVLKYCLGDFCGELEPESKPELTFRPVRRILDNPFRS